eukprot:Pgem_evm1s17631
MANAMAQIESLQAKITSVSAEHQSKFGELQQQYQQKQQEQQDSFETIKIEYLAKIEELQQAGANN